MLQACQINRKNRSFFRSTRTTLYRFASQAILATIGHERSVYFLPFSKWLPPWYACPTAHPRLTSSSSQQSLQNGHVHVRSTCRGGNIDINHHLRAYICPQTRKMAIWTKILLLIPSATWKRYKKMLEILKALLHTNSYPPFVLNILESIPHSKSPNQEVIVSLCATELPNQPAEPFANPRGIFQTLTNTPFTIFISPRDTLAFQDCLAMTSKPIKVHRVEKTDETSRKVHRCALMPMGIFS